MSETPAFWLGSIPFAGSLLTCDPSDGSPITAPAVAARASVPTTLTTLARLRIELFTATSLDLGAGVDRPGQTPRETRSARQYSRQS